MQLLKSKRSLNFFKVIKSYSMSFSAAGSFWTEINKLFGILFCMFMWHITVIGCTRKCLCAYKTYWLSSLSLTYSTWRTYLGSLLELRRQVRLEARQVIYDLGCRARRHQIRGVAKPTPGSSWGGLRARSRLVQN